jgi:hypothetical protein
MTNLEGGLPESLREGSGRESDLAVPATVLPSTTTVDMELSEVQSKGIDTSLHAFQGYDVSHFRSSFFSVEICPLTHLEEEKNNNKRPKLFHILEPVPVLAFIRANSLLGLQINKRNCFF